ncbi:MAG: ATPase, T2SS/T4P/T4SS family [Paracoccaceae bacterium]|nr:ATPase, T2SS/T4P/T4SS family [Paracoccaceae bacterium]MDE2675570.1 ATPase, T2SS/T4P/T4SS family [Paracoccaceae bacterium]MYG10532.1 hypothetical protein [Paracoccaceae bacterium]MYJ88191.1 hypothetical protein [Paracoccaceae bacterium]
MTDDFSNKANTGSKQSILSSEGLPSEITSGILISGNGGRLEVSKRERSRIAVFQNGYVVVTPESRWSSEVKAILDRAGRAEIAIHEIMEADSKSILAIYERNSRNNNETASKLSGIERQRELRRIIADAARMNASDIHFYVFPSFSEIKVRIHGRLRRLSIHSTEEGKAIINAAFAVATDQGSETGSTSFLKGALTRVSGLLPPGVDLVRLQYSPTTGHCASLVMRIKYSNSRGDHDLKELGFLSRQVSDIGLMRKRTSGLYLLAGKVSSGKTTTLQRILNTMVREKNHEISIYSIEEPVELDINGAIHVGVYPKPHQTRSEAFIEAIKATLRSDPNVVVLGELRDRELAGYAIELALTGHALWTTVHAGSALGILDRLSDLGIEHWKLTEPSVVRGLIFQRLLGVLCPNCKIGLPQGRDQGRISDFLLKEITNLLDSHPDKIFIRGSGCDSCLHGLIGRTVVAETILPDLNLLQHYASNNRVRMRKYWLSPAEKGGCGGKPILHNALIKVGKGICDINEVEEEIDLLQSYKSEYPYHASILAREWRNH